MQSFNETDGVASEAALGAFPAIVHETSGDPAIDRFLAPARDLPDAPIADHTRVYATIHESLSQALHDLMDDHKHGR